MGKIRISLGNFTPQLTAEGELIAQLKQTFAPQRKIKTWDFFDLGILHQAVSKRCMIVAMSGCWIIPAAQVFWSGTSWYSFILPPFHKSSNALPKATVTLGPKPSQLCQAGLTRQAPSLVWDIEMDERNHNKCSYFYETEYIYLTKISKNGREEHWEGLKNITAKRRSMWTVLIS